MQCGITGTQTRETRRSDHRGARREAHARPSAACSHVERQTTGGLTRSRAPPDASPTAGLSRQSDARCRGRPQPCAHCPATRPPSPHGAHVAATRAVSHRGTGRCRSGWGGGQGRAGPPRGSARRCATPGHAGALQCGTGDAAHRGGLRSARSIGTPRDALDTASVGPGSQPTRPCRAPLGPSWGAFVKKQPLSRRIARALGATMRVSKTPRPVMRQSMRGVRGIAERLHGIRMGCIASVRRQKQAGTPGNGFPPRGQRSPVASSAGRVRISGTGRWRSSPPVQSPPGRSSRPAGGQRGPKKTLPLSGSGRWRRLQRRRGVSSWTSCTCISRRRWCAWSPHAASSLWTWASRVRAALYHRWRRGRHAARRRRIGCAWCIRPRTPPGSTQWRDGAAFWSDGCCRGQVFPRLRTCVSGDWPALSIAMPRWPRPFNGQTRDGRSQSNRLGISARLY